MTENKQWNASSLDAVQKYLDRVTRDFISGLRGCWIAFTRYPHADRWLLHRATDEFLESAISILWLAHQGVFNAGRREGRYMLEAVAKYVYVDQQDPGDTPLEERLKRVDDLPRSSIDPIDHVVLRMQPDPKVLADAVHSEFGALSGFVHVSKAQIEERLRRASRGEYSGFEGPRTVEAFTQAIRRVYDLVLALMFEGIGPSFTGDLFVQLFDQDARWVFHRTRFVQLVSQQFDYKQERQGR